MMELHKYTGTYIHILVTATILLGIQEKEGFVSCAYAVDSADLMPILNYVKIPYACKISHGLGLVILCMGLFTSFGLARFPVL
jgi:cytochrome b-561